MTNAEFIANVIIEVMTDDPAKIIEAQADAKMMTDLGAAFGYTRAQLMAEYSLVMFRSMNKSNFPELKTLTAADDQLVQDLIAAHIEKAGW